MIVKGIFRKLSKAASTGHQLGSSLAAKLRNPSKVFVLIPSPCAASKSVILDTASNASRILGFFNALDRQCLRFHIHHDFVGPSRDPMLREIAIDRLRERAQVIR